MAPWPFSSNKLKPNHVSGGTDPRDAAFAALREENKVLREAVRRLLAQMPPAVFKSTPETPLSLWGVELTVADAIVLYDAFYVGKD